MHRISPLLLSVGECHHVARHKSGADSYRFHSAPSGYIDVSLSAPDDSPVLYLELLCPFSYGGYSAVESVYDIGIFGLSVDEVLVRVSRSLGLYERLSYLDVEHAVLVKI